MKYLRTTKITTSIEGEIVIFDETGGRYYVLNGVGARIWELLERPSSKIELINSLTSEYSIDEETCEAEVDSFLDDLVKNQLVIMQK